ncbi:MAG: hypothetical protein KKB50_06250 [Planctomycetes bacterium]|nr:hypothetical protein [Planctomycetota bacterium]
MPMSARGRWQCGIHNGDCRLVEVAPGGAVFLLPLREASQLEPPLTLDVELESGMSWRVTQKAELVRRNVAADGACKISVAFPRDEYD